MTDQAGVTAVEYALLASLIAVVIVAIVWIVGTDLAGAFRAAALR